MSKKAWFPLPADSSPEAGLRSSQDFVQLQPDSSSDLTWDSALSQYSSSSSSQLSHLSQKDLSQYSSSSSQLSHLSQKELSQLSQLSQKDLSQYSSSSSQLSRLSQKELSQLSHLSQKDLSQYSSSSSQLSRLSQKELSQLSLLAQKNLSQYSSKSSQLSRSSQKDLSQISQSSQKDLSQLTDLSQYSHISKESLSLNSEKSLKNLSQISQLSDKELSQYSETSQKADSSKCSKKPVSHKYSPKHSRIPLPQKDVLRYSRTSQKDLSQYSEISQELSQYSAQSSMDPNSTSEYSTNDSQEVSSLQQDSTDGGFDDANSTSSMQEEAVQSAIMEVSGELMLGNFSPHKQPSGGSESSDISDDDARRAVSGGSIAKYPESYSGMSDNDWNPYATESDTNQTPRSPRSTTSDDQNRIGYVSRATINVVPPQKFKDSTATVSMTTGEVTVGPSQRTERPAENSGQRQKDQDYNTDSTSQRLDMLRYLVDKEADEISPRAEEERDSEPDKVRSPEPEYAGPGVGVRERFEPVGDDDDRESRDSPETVKSVHTEDTLSARQSLDSKKSDDSDTLYGRRSSEFDQDVDNRRQSGESGRSRQSVDSWKSGASGRLELEKSGDSNMSGRQSVDSHHSQKSGQSEQSQRSGQSEQSQRSSGRSSDRSEKLEKLIDGAGSDINEVIKFENAQRVTKGTEELGGVDATGRREAAGSPVTRMRLTAKLQPYTGQGTTRINADAPNLVGKTGYVSIAEREKLVSESPDTTQDSQFPGIPRLELERPRPSHSTAHLPNISEVERSPSEVSMRRVSNLFEETKMAARAAVAITRPEPSGSEERFPLRDRMDHSIHESSLMAPEQRASFEYPEEKLVSRPRDSEVTRSITSEEVARVLGKYAENDADNVRRSQPNYNEKSPVVSAFNRSDNETENSYTNTSASSRGTANSSASHRMDDMSDDEIARRVKAILSEKDKTGLSGDNGRTYLAGKGLDKAEYVPRTIDYSRLQRDLEEIQDSLHDVPKPTANDSLHVMAREGYDGTRKRISPASDDYRSLESTSTTTRGRESGASESGRMVWDHGADLQYDTDYDGKFLGTMTSSETMSTRLRYGTASSDDMVVRPISSASNDTERDVPDFESTGSRTLTGTDISRAEKLVQQVLNRQAEGDLKENVEDIIARYRNERQNMYDRLRTEPDPESIPRRTVVPEIPASLKKPDLYITAPPTDENKEQSGLAERVFKILSGKNEDKENENPGNKGMAKEVYKILTRDPPHQQVNGILTETTAVENEMLKQMVTRPKEDSSMDDSGLNESGDSFKMDDKDVRKQLEYSQFSNCSPNKTGMSDLASIRKVTSAPYSSVNNVKSLLSSQLQKVSLRNFDKSVEFRTPHRQTVNCYPVYGMDVEGNRGTEGNRPREAWNEGERPTADATTRPSALSSERFFLTDKDQTPVRSHLPRTDDQQARHRTRSDPFDISPSRKSADPYRDGHPRSKSEEATSLSDLSQYSFQDLPSSPIDNPRSPKSTGKALMTPNLHRSQVQPNALRSSVQSTTSSTINKTRSDWGYECYTSDSSGPCCPSDSSDGNIWHHHGYQMYANTKTNPFIDKDNTAHPKTKHLVVRTTNMSIEASESEDSQCCGNYDITPSPYKKQRSDGRSRPRLRQRSPPHRKIKNPMSRSLPDSSMSRSLPSQRVAPSSGDDLRSPISRDDVYELLCRSQKQEEKLHELRSKLFQHDIGNTDTVSGQSVSSGNHGDVRIRSDKARSLKPIRKQDYSRRDGSPTESDISRSRKGSQLRPYRPPGSRDMYYTESGDDTNESGTTLESTHPGSDDAIPPYIPQQFLGSRQDEPAKHPTGIYGRKDKDDLSTIDENSVKDEKEKALSLSTNSNHSNPGKTSAGDSRSGRKSPSIRSNPDSGIGTTTLTHDSRETLRSDLGSTATRLASQYNSNPGNPSNPPARSRSPNDANPGNPATRSRLPYDSNPANQGTRSMSPYDSNPGNQEARSRSPYSQSDDPARRSAYGISRDRQPDPLERPGFKTREEFQREFEARERALQEELTRYRQREKRESDNLGASVRSDPGGMLEEAGQRWEYRESTDGQTFRQLQPEPAYPQDRLRYSRSRSETDLVALSPTESQKYSSPMQPGTRFLELSTQPSPIFSHQDSITLQPRGRGAGPEELPRGRGAVPEELPRVPTEMPRRNPEPQELPRVDDRARASAKPNPSNEELVRPLEPAVDPRQPLDPIELGADPRRMGGMRRSPKDRSSGERAKSPLYSRQKEMERELEKLNQELTEQVNELHEKKAEPEEFEDNFPPSKKAQVLREVLEQEYQDNIPPNINDMWLRFKEKKEQSMTESSLNSTRLEALSGLLENPTRHSSNSAKKDRSKGSSRSKAVEVEKEELEQSEKENVSDELLQEKRAMEVRSLRRQELKQRSGLSEEESNGSYTELLMDKERKMATERVRNGGRGEERKDRTSKKNKSPDKAAKSKRKTEKDKSNDKASITDIRNRNFVNTQHSDTMDTLFSIPEDASFEQSPTKAESDLKSRQRRHRHVIDPLMMKLRDKIKLQRDKIDKERRKELQRMEKLKKLQMLLNAKTGGQLSDKAIHVELENVSTTSSCTHSETSHILSDTSLTAVSTAGESEMSSQESSTLRESTLDSIKIQPKKYPQQDFARPIKPVVYSSSTDTSDFSNIIVERIVEGKPAKSDRKSSSKKGSGKVKKSKIGEDGKRIRKEKKKKVSVFDVDISYDDLQQQIRQYRRQTSPDGRRAHSATSPERRRTINQASSPERRRTINQASSPERRRTINQASSPERRRTINQASSPERRRMVQDASTMYPSPITVSPPSRRRIRDVLMRSEAIQTSPSVRSSSPTHCYDEVPVAPVPTMSRSRTSKKRPSPSPPRSAPVIQRKSSKSPARSSGQQTSPRQYSRSPPREKTTRSSSAKARQPAPVIRKPVDDSMWKVETELPPANSMFTPESPITGQQVEEKPGQAWFIPMKPSKPWQQPQKERHAFAVRQEAWAPSSVTQSTWNKIVHGDMGKDREDPNDISRDTKFDLDPDGQPIRDETDSEESDYDDSGKPLSKMTLQEAFTARKQSAISQLRERQKRLNLAAEERRMQHFLQQEREKLFQEERRKEANPDAHPYSENLHKPVRRVITKEEMKEMALKKYKKLPEVLNNQMLKKRQEDYSLNRLKARLYNRRIQKRVLQKADKWGR